MSENTANAIGASFLDAEIYKVLFYDVPVGLIIVDENTELTDANEYMFRYFRMPREDVKGKRFGNIFNCSAAVTEHTTCGSAKECGNCALRIGVTGVLENRNEIREIELSHEFVLNNRKTTKWFTVNAKPITMDDKNAALIAMTDITNRKKLEEELTFLGIIDGLTGLFNRRYIIQKLRSLGEEGKTGFSIAMIDIDKFKNINDTYGHLTGDKVLATLSEIIKKNIRSTDFAGRYGGEEFLLILPNASEKEAADVLGRIADRFRNCLKEMISTPLTFSGGVVGAPQSGSIDFDPEALLEKADKLLYAAKAEGRDRIKISGL